VTPQRFREQMHFLASGGYTVVDVVEAARLLDAASPPPRVVGLSFDDAYLDVAQEALPILAEHGFRATVFIPTGAVDGSVTFAWYEKPPPLMSWDDIIALDGGRLHFEAHTVTHLNLLTLDAADAGREIAASKQTLEQRLGRRVQAFCYPAGLFGPRERRLVAQAGYEVAVSCEPGLNVSDTDRLALHRNAVEASDRLLDFPAKLGGGHHSPLPLRGLYRRLRYNPTPSRA
jgi:peptidoglycan/xylan/chitin deacetylase (PgdA/CDA1 family)